MLASLTLTHHGPLPADWVHLVVLVVQRVGGYILELLLNLGRLLALSLKLVSELATL